MPGDDDETGGAVIILSVALPADCGPSLDELVSEGKRGATREEVVQHIACKRLSRGQSGHD